MIKFWITTLFLFVASIYLLYRFTVKVNRNEAGEKTWKYGYGRSAYWRILCFCSIGLTASILFFIHWIGVPIF